LSAKRLEIAKALSTNPTLLMLDEIFAGLSFEEGEQMIDMLNNLNKRKNITILLIDHNLRMVKQMVKKTTVINMGAIIAEGSFEEIIEDQEVRKAYVG
jgi:branched-chain amino acid transport system ATP-binding protein